MHAWNIKGKDLDLGTAEFDSRPGHLFDDTISGKSFQAPSVYSGDPNKGFAGIVPRVRENVCKVFQRIGKQQIEAELAFVTKADVLFITAIYSYQSCLSFTVIRYSPRRRWRMATVLQPTPPLKYKWQHWFEGAFNAEKKDCCSSFADESLTFGKQGCSVGN